MALSESVETSLIEAQSHLKNALSYSARQEAPLVSVEIAKTIQSIDMIRKYDNFLDKIDELMKKNNNDGTIF